MVVTIMTIKKTTITILMTIMTIKKTIIVDFKYIKHMHNL